MDSQQLRRIQAPRPAEWFFKESITVIAPHGEANVIISGEPLSPHISVDRYAEVQGELLAAEFPGYHQDSFEPSVVFGHHLGYLRQFSWRPPDGVPVTQLQCYAVQESRGYTGTATTPTTGFGRHEDVLRWVLASASIDG
jgi:hypothetical protein